MPVSSASKTKSSGCQIVRLGLEGATTFSGKKTGVQTRLKKHAPYSVFSTITVPSCNWLACKLPIVQLESVKSKERTLLTLIILCDCCGCLL